MTAFWNRNIEKSGWWYVWVFSILKIASFHICCWRGSSAPAPVLTFRNMYVADRAMIKYSKWTFFRSTAQHKACASEFRMKLAVYQRRREPRAEHLSVIYIFYRFVFFKNVSNLMTVWRWRLIEWGVLGHASITCCHDASPRLRASPPQ